MHPALILAASLLLSKPQVQAADLEVNDLHSQLNATRVAEVRQPHTNDDLLAIVKEATQRKLSISIAGGRHAMGGQQFAEGSILVDMRSMHRVLKFDKARAQVTVEAGIEWPELIDALLEAQKGQAEQVSIRQKQTGADRLTIGGALACNGHGRGLAFKPMVDDVESFRLVDANARLINCSRTENKDLFDLAIGGYGLFGIISDVTMRLYPRTKLERVVEITDIDHLMPKIDQRIHDGFMYGDLQYSIDPNDPAFLDKGVFSTYRPLSPNTVMPTAIRELKAEDWAKLYYLAHTDKSRAFDVYSKYYLTTHGQKYWSDTHQLSIYLDHYHEKIDAATHAKAPGSEMITELYVPRAKLAAFMQAAAGIIKRNNANVIYGTVRFIEKDDETFLAWAKQPYAAIIFNLHLERSPAGLERAKTQFRDLIDAALANDGSYYLTYHRWATRQQVLKAYPQFIAFLNKKQRFDPQTRFTSEWYRHYAQMFKSDIKQPPKQTP